MIHKSSNAALNLPWQAANRNLTKGLSLRAGAPCDNFQGYCDVFLKCRQVNCAKKSLKAFDSLFAISNEILC